ncbi:MAG TPA: histidine kinase [Microbacteriaceae bacterium]|nr:histidine kinase [Microbacteriaceae bacterium]
MTSPPGPQLSVADHLGGGELRLPRQPGVIRLFWARHPRLTDTILAVVLGGLAATGGLRIADFDAGLGWLSIGALLLIVVSVAGLYVRRTRPLTAVALGAAVILASVWAAGEIVLAPIVFAVYSVPVYRSVRAGWAAAAVVWAASVLATVVGETFPRPGGAVVGFGPDLVPGFALLSFAIQFGVVLALALAIGINVGNRRRYLAALIDRARQLAVERDQQGQLATAAERARIAREMHDIVSHSLTVMIALAEGSAVSADEAAPDAAEAMRKAADTGRAAMVDMRRMLGVLGGDVEIAPQPGFADLPDLIDRFRSLGVPVAYRHDGSPAPDPAVQLAVYRVVQEALTNALRYARGPTEVAVRIGVDDDVLTAEITDDGLAGFPTEPAGTGHGLLGLRERVAALGGTLTTGPRRDGRGWSVEAALPLGESAGPGASADAEGGRS